MVGRIVEGGANPTIRGQEGSWKVSVERGGVEAGQHISDAHEAQLVRPFEGQNGRLATLGIVAGRETGDLAGDVLTPPTLLVLTARIGQRLSLYLSGEIT